MRKKLFLFLESLPRFFSSPRLTYWFIFFLGIINLWSGLSGQSKFPAVLNLFLPWLSSATRSWAIFSGVSLIYIASGLVRQQKNAWLVTEWLLLLNAVFHFLNFSLPAAAANFFFALWLYQQKNEFLGAVFSFSWRWLGAVFFSLFIFIVLFWWRKETFLGLEISRLSFVFLILIVFYDSVLVFQALRERREDGQKNWLLAKKIVSRCSCVPADVFKIWPANKQFLFSSQKDAVLAFVRYENNFLGVGDPLGPSRQQIALLKKFFQEALEKKGIPLIFGAGEKTRDLARKAGLKTAYVADEAIIDLRDDPYQIKELRNVMTKLTKRRGYFFQMEKPPLAEKTFQELRKVFLSWKKEIKRKEGTPGVFGGGWMAPLVKNCAVGIVRDKNRKVMAFATVINGLAPKTAVIDLMCRSPIADNGAMEFLFSEIWRWLRERNWRYLDLGGAPREGVVLEKLSFKKIRKVLPKKLVSFTVWKEAVLKLPSLLLHLSPQKIVSFASQSYLEIIIGMAGIYGLRKFKEKFRPLWQRRFVIYRHPLDVVYFLWSISFLRGKKQKLSSSRKPAYLALCSHNQKLFAQK